MSGNENPWRTMQTAPKDGTKIDLMFPYPRGRTIDCFWRRGEWVWMTPHWDNGELLAEAEWFTHSYPNMNPLAWMPSPPRPWALPTPTDKQEA